MEPGLNIHKLKNEFNNYLGTVFLKNLSLIMGMSIIILSYYMYSDWNVRDNRMAALTRIIPLSFMFFLLGIHLIFKHRFFRLKNTLYILIYIFLQLMMYGKCLIHLHDDALAPSVTGAIMVIFLVSLDVKQKKIIALLIYAIPITIFSFLLLFMGKPSAKEFFILADIYPIVALGYVVNQIHYRLRFRLFKSNYLLNLEQQKTRALYNETLQINNELEQKANEAIVIKEEIEKKNEELNMSNATKDRFLGIIAHDLKNPISAIWGLSDLLLVDDKMDKKQKNECVDTINKCVKHTHGLLENLLNWAMAQNKSISHNPFVHNANVIVENELKILRQVADKKQIKIENNVPADFNIYADLNMFETIIRNLVSNAIKYTYPNGHIKINARIVNDNNILYSEIAVADNGVGMVSDKIEKLFQITKDISTRGTENEEGTGLGLLLCKEFVELHNGTINVDSTPGKGSVFRFVIPVVNVHKNN